MSPAVCIISNDLQGLIGAMRRATCRNWKNSISFFLTHCCLPFVYMENFVAKAFDGEHVYEDTTTADLKQVRGSPYIAPLGTNNPICGA
jgi:hypothetical protein